MVEHQQRRETYDNETVLNTLASAATNKWYGDIIRVVADAASEGLAVSQIRDRAAEAKARVRECTPDQIDLPQDKIESAVVYLTLAGVLARTEKDSYTLTSIAQQHLDLLEPLEPPFKEALR